MLKYLFNYRLIYFFSLQLALGATTPNNILLQSQSPLNKQLIWLNLESDTFQYPYLLPAIEPDFSSDSNYKLFQNWHKFSNDSVFFRSYYSLLNESNNLYQNINGSIQIQMNEYIYLQNDFEFSDNPNLNQHFNGQIVESGLGWAGYLQSSSLLFYYSDNYFIFGNGNVFTSPFSSSLLINANIPPYTYFFWHHNIKSIKFDWSLILLEPINSKQRFISLHRYEYDNVFWKIGFTELSLVSYDRIGGQEIEYILPSSVFLESEVNGSVNSNLMWCLDFSIKYYGYTIINELLIDDFSLDGKSPQRVAFQTIIGHSQENFNYYIKYSRLNRWVGNYYFPELRFTYYDKLIGHPLGPDAHSLEISFNKRLPYKIYFEGQLIWKEFGSSDINDWPESMTSSNDFNFGYSKEVFPSRPIYNEKILSLSVDCKLFDKLKSGIKINYSTIMSTTIKLELNLII